MMGFKLHTPDEITFYVIMVSKYCRTTSDILANFAHVRHLVHAMLIQHCTALFQGFVSRVKS